MDVATAVEHVAVASGRGEVSGQHVVAVDGGVEVLEVVCSRERLSEHVCRQREAVRTRLQAERGCQNMSAERETHRQTDRGCKKWGTERLS